MGYSDVHTVRYKPWSRQYECTYPLDHPDSPEESEQKAKKNGIVSRAVEYFQGQVMVAQDVSDIARLSRRTSLRKIIALITRAIGLFQRVNEC